MASKAEVVALSSAVAAMVPGLVAASPARADNSGGAVYSGVNMVRQACGPIGDDPRLTAAAQRHADDMLRNGLGGHVGSDGSSPQARIADAGYTRTGATGEIVYWGTGSAATPSAAVDAWMGSPPHRSIILNCAFITGGFATASDGTKMTAVGDFAGP